MRIRPFQSLRRSLGQLKMNTRIFWHKNECWVEMSRLLSKRCLCIAISRILCQIMIPWSSLASKGHQAISQLHSNRTTINTRCQVLLVQLSMATNLYLIKVLNSIGLVALSMLQVKWNLLLVSDPLACRLMNNSTSSTFHAEGLPILSTKRDSKI